ncbi:T9SS type A sorting domain-containing protein [Candidatus Neomarinimicrobiota bacterium]
MNRILLPLIVLASASVVLPQDPESFNLKGFVSLDTVTVSGPWGGFSADVGSRGLTAGSDLDQDGKQEVFVAHYDHGGGVAGFEMGKHNLELIWYSDITPEEGGNLGTRMVQTGDLDGDGIGEIIFFRGGYLWDLTRGLYVYEYNGSDNGFDLVYHNMLATLSGDSISWIRIIEYFVVEDIDNDGIQELVFPLNGPNSMGPSRSEDFVSVISFPGGFDGGDEALVEEYWISPRDVDKDGVIENRLGGGSPVTVAITDIDGDSQKEVYCHVWNWFNGFFFEVVGPDTYTLGDTTYVMATLADSVDDFSIMQPAVADMNHDGRDEIYLGSYYLGKIFKIEDMDGDATSFTSDEIQQLPREPISTLGAIAYDFTADGTPEIYFGASATTGMDVITWDGVSFDHFLTDPLAVGFVSKLAVANLDGDNKSELVTSHQDLYLYERHKYICRVSEHSRPDLIPPDPPVMVAAHPGHDQISLTWNMNRDGDFLEYVVYGDTLANPTISLDTLVMYYDTTMLVQSLFEGTTYHFRVKALDAKYNESSYSNEMVATTLGVSPGSSGLRPARITLHQNYPNPFNPSTTLRYELPQAAQVTLAIYDLLGREVTTLVEGYAQPGTHMAVWNAGSYPSGIYLVRLVTPGYAKTIKLVLLK